MSTDPYFRTVLVVEVLTAREAWNGDLGELSEDIVEGNASGDIKMRVVEQLSADEASRLLTEQGSDPGLLGIDESDDDQADEDYTGQQAWLEPIGSGDGVYGPYEDEVEASAAIDASAGVMTDETHKIVWRPVPDDDDRDTTLDMNEIVRLVEEAGVAAVLVMTGGGCGTIYAGRRIKDATEDENDRYAAVAGPGDYSTGHADAKDFYVGPDDDDGAHAIPCIYSGAITNDLVAKLIVAQATQPDPSTGLDADTLDALGLDGTGRGLSARTCP